MTALACMIFFGETHLWPFEQVRVLQIGLTYLFLHQTSRGYLSL